MKLFDYVNHRRQQGIERAATSAGDASNGQLKAVWKSELYCEQSRCPEDGYELMDSPSDQVCPECDFRLIKIPPTFKKNP